MGSDMTFEEWSGWLSMVAAVLVLIAMMPERASNQGPIVNAIPPVAANIVATPGKLPP